MFAYVDNQNELAFAPIDHRLNQTEGFSFVLQKGLIPRPKMSQWLLILQGSRLAIHPVCALLSNTHSHRSGPETFHGHILISAQCSWLGQIDRRIILSL